MRGETGEGFELVGDAIGGIAATCTTVALDLGRVSAAVRHQRHQVCFVVGTAERANRCRHCANDGVVFQSELSERIELPLLNRRDGTREIIIV